MSKFTILGAGFIGKNLIESCLSNGHVVRVLDRNPCPDEFCDNTEWIQGTFDSLESVSRAIAGSDVIFHLISNTVPGDKVEVEEELFDNLSQTIQLLKLCVRESVKRVVFISSASVYGVKTDIPINELALPNPISSHGIQKLAIEYYMRLYNYEFNLDCKIMRLSNPYGERQNLYGRQGFISILIGNLLAGKQINIRGDGKAIRDFIYITDVVDACLLLASIDTKEITFNIGSGDGVSLNGVISEVESVLGRELAVSYVEPRLGDISSSILNITKAQSLLGYTPSVSLREGLSKFFSHNGLL